MKIKAAVCNGLHEKLVIEEVELDSPKANEVLVEIVATGVCHTDISVQEGIFQMVFPNVLGHEGAGIIREVGPGVTSYKPGDHVVISYAYCGACDICLSGKPGHCSHLPELNFGGIMEDGTTRLSKDGKPIHTFFGQSTFATHAVTNTKNLIKVDDDLPLENLGPLGCGIITGSATVLEGIKPEFGSTIAVFGCGSVGLSAIMAAKIAGCKQIIGVDIVPERLEMAKQLGATDVVNGKEVDTVEEIMRLTNNKGVDYGAEFTGNGFVIDQAIKSAKHNGEIVFVAGGPDVNINFTAEILFKVKTIKGMIEGEVAAKKFIPQLIEYYKKGQFPFDKLITFYDFEDINQAIADSTSGKVIKPIVRMK